VTPTDYFDSTRAVELVRKCVSQELRPGAPLPHDEVDLVREEHIDSMGWVGVLTAIEDATRIPHFGSSWPEERPQNIRSLVELMLQPQDAAVKDAASPATLKIESVNAEVSIVGWGVAPGSLRIDATTIERECGLETGTIRERAGIESVCRAADHENELTLGLQAAEAALEAATLNPENVDVVVVTSATFLSLPSLAATLHNRLLLRESCGAFDVGGACVAVIHALATAKALLSAAQREVALVVASEVNSRRLSSPQVPGEFRGLFGDGACAFVLSRSDSSPSHAPSKLGSFVWGCAGDSASALHVGLHQSGDVAVQFNGKQLGQAAVSQLDRVVGELENLTGRSRATIDYFAIHEPNPRLVSVFAKTAGIPQEKLASISRTHGNLGSATCGASLCRCLTEAQSNRTSARRPMIFVAAVGPGLLWGGTYIH